MPQVVQGGAETRVGEVAEHEEIGGEEEDGEERPAKEERMVDREGDEQEGGVVELEEE